MGRGEGKRRGQGISDVMALRSNRVRSLITTRYDSSVQNNFSKNDAVLFSGSEIIYSSAFHQIQ